jgi:hypothetical protein
MVENDILGSNNGGERYSWIKRILKITDILGPQKLEEEVLVSAASSIDWWRCDAQPQQNVKVWMWLHIIDRTFNLL